MAALARLKGDTVLLFRRASADAVVGLVTIAIGIFVGAVALGYPFGRDNVLTFFLNFKLLKINIRDN